MKAKKLEKKLVLGKQTISTLEESMMNNVHGGGDTLATICKTGCVTDCLACERSRLSLCCP